MKTERASSVCSEEAPSSPESPSFSDTSSPSAVGMYEDEGRLFHFPTTLSSTEEEPPFNPPPTAPYSIRTQLIRAVLDDAPRELRRILTRHSSKGAPIDLNFFTPDGQTLLTQACLSACMEVVKTLLSFGASVTLTNRDGFSPLHVACWRGKPQLAQALMRHASEHS